MPIYEFHCDVCDVTWEEVRMMSESSLPSVCGKCGKKGRMIYSVHSSRPFRKRWFEHIAPEPVFVESDSQLKKVCKENDSIIIDDNREKTKKYWNSRKKDLKKSESKRKEMASGKR